MEPSAPSSSYADAADLVARALDAFLPPSRVSTADFAASNRYLANEGGGYVGRWDHAKAPYLVAIMDALDDTEHTTVAVPGPGQCGKTAVGENWLFKMVCTDPANVLWFAQQEPVLQAYVKRVINTMIASHPDLQKRQLPDRINDSLKYKGFLGMAVEFLPATHANLTNKAAGRIIADEYDAYKIGLSEGGYADPKTLLDVRRSTFGAESKLFAMSHGDRAAGSRPQDWNAGIFALYRDSDRRVWYWQCPHCTMWSSPNPGTQFHTAFDYDAKLPAGEVGPSAHLVCPHNGCIIADSDRVGMNLTGKWVGLGQQIDPETGAVTGTLAHRDIAGFWIVGTMSPFLFGGIGGLAEALVKAQREFEETGSDESLRQVVVKQLGHGYDPPKSVGSLDAETLAARADQTLALRQVANGVRFITAAIDIQGNRFEVLFRGFGVGAESWIIEHRIIADVLPATDPDAWDRLLRDVAATEFPLADGSGRVMGVLGIGFDSSGEPGVTVQAMSAWRRARKDGRAKSLGMISGRPAYRLMPLKGGSKTLQKRLQIVMPDARQDRHSTARGDVPVGLFAPNYFKDAEAARLAVATPGAGYVHFPNGLPAEFYPQLVAEQRQKNGQWDKVRARNEAWDLLVMTGVMAHLFAPSAFDWTRPPPWARVWDENRLVGAPNPAEHAARGKPPAPAPAPAAPAQRAPAPRAVEPRMSFEDRVAAIAARRGTAPPSIRRI